MSDAVHICDQCGKKMKRTAKCEFYCKKCDNTIFDWSLQYEGRENEYEYDIDETNWRDAEDGTLDMESVKRKKRWF